MQYVILFLEGIITFISPCLLPMLPVYISYFAGGEQSSAGKTVRNSLGFVLGFTTVFVLMGAFAGTVGMVLQKYKTVLNIVTGAVVVFFGLNYMGLLKLNLFRGIGASMADKPLGFFSAFTFGLVFSIGWTPCVGAFLGSALMMASQQGTVLKGILLLLVYSMGLGIPFVLSALLIDKLKGAFGIIKRHYKLINRISGSLLVIVGILMMTGLLGKYIALLN